MNKNELLEVLKNFKKSNENVILIDGKWGSGKTYLINEFMSNYHEVPIYYVSMLGSKNVDDLNTSLYLEVNKDNVKEFSNIIPRVINPIKVKGKTSTSLDFILKKDKECNAIIVFDDFERYSSSDYDEFLSYISLLLLSKVKIIVVSNLKELGGGEKLIFNDFKEKIFDHVYKAELFSNDIIEVKFGKFYKYVNKDLVNILKDNIRLVDKSKNFLGSILDTVNFLEEDEKFISQFVFITCVFVSILYKQNKLNYASESTIRTDNKFIKKLKNEFADEDSYWEILHVYEYFINNYSVKKFAKLDVIILAFYKAYVYADYNDLKAFFEKRA